MGINILPGMCETAGLSIVCIELTTRAANMLCESKLAITKNDKSSGTLVWILGFFQLLEDLVDFFLN